MLACEFHPIFREDDETESTKISDAREECDVFSGTFTLYIYYIHMQIENISIYRYIVHISSKSERVVLGLLDGYSKRTMKQRFPVEWEGCFTLVFQSYRMWGSAFGHLLKRRPFPSTYSPRFWKDLGYNFPISLPYFHLLHLGEVASSRKPPNKNMLSFLYPIALCMRTIMWCIWLCILCIPW